MTNAALARHWFMHSRHTAIGMGGNRPAQLSPPPDVRLAPSERLLHVGVFAGCEAGMETAAERLVVHFNRHPQMIAVRPWRETAAYAAPDLPPVPVAEHAWGHAAHDDTCDDYDCLVLLGWPAADDRRRLKQIELYCRDDRPVVALRTLDAEMPGWADFCEEVFGGRLGKKGDSPNLPTHCAGAPRPVAQMGTVPLFPGLPLFPGWACSSRLVRLPLLALRLAASEEAGEEVWTEMRNQQIADDREDDHRDDMADETLQP